MDFETILLDLAEDGVATLTLNRPEAMNAWNATMAYEVDQALRRLDLDDDVRSVVITGAGRAFCAGADLSGGTSFSPGRDSPEVKKRRERSVHQDAPPAGLRHGGPDGACVGGPGVGVG